MKIKNSWRILVWTFSERKLETENTMITILTIGKRIYYQYPKKKFDDQ